MLSCRSSGVHPVVAQLSTFREEVLEPKGIAWWIDVDSLAFIGANHGLPGNISTTLRSKPVLGIATEDSGFDRHKCETTFEGKRRTDLCNRIFLFDAGQGIPHRPKCTLAKEVEAYYQEHYYNGGRLTFFDAMKRKVRRSTLVAECFGIAADDFLMETKVDKYITKLEDAQIFKKFTCKDEGTPTNIPLVCPMTCKCRHGRGDVKAELPPMPSAADQGTEDESLHTQAQTPVAIIAPPHAPRAPPQPHTGGSHANRADRVPTAPGLTGMVPIAQLEAARRRIASLEATKCALEAKLQGSLVVQGADGIAKRRCLRGEEGKLFGQLVAGLKKPEQGGVMAINYLNVKNPGRLVCIPQSRKSDESASRYTRSRRAATAASVIGGLRMGAQSLKLLEKRMGWSHKVAVAHLSIPTANDLVSKLGLTGSAAQNFNTFAIEHNLAVRLPSNKVLNEAVLQLTPRYDIYRTKLQGKSDVEDDNEEDDDDGYADAAAAESTTSAGKKEKVMVDALVVAFRLDSAWSIEIEFLFKNDLLVSRWLRSLPRCGMTCLVVMIQTDAGQGILRIGSNFINTDQPCSPRRHLPALTAEPLHRGGARPADNYAVMEVLVDMIYGWWDMMGVMALRVGCRVSCGVCIFPVRSWSPIWTGNWEQTPKLFFSPEQQTDFDRHVAAGEPGTPKEHRQRRKATVDCSAVVIFNTARECLGVRYTYKPSEKTPEQPVQGEFLYALFREPVPETSCSSGADRV